MTELHTAPPVCDMPRWANEEGTSPPGIRRIGTQRDQHTFVPDVKVRCNSQLPGAPPLFSRPRFAWNRNEVSGALGDLGTFLPHILGAIAVVGMAPTGVLTGFGLLYLASGLFYGVPMGVQPMKAASAAVLIQRLEPGEIVGAGLVIGVLFLLLGATGLITRLTRVVPPSVTAGLQLGIGLSLAVLGVRLIGEQPWLGILVGALMLVLLNNRRFPVLHARCDLRQDHVALTKCRVAPTNFAEWPRLRDRYRPLVLINGWHRNESHEGFGGKRVL